MRNGEAAVISDPISTISRISDFENHLEIALIRGLEGQGNDGQGDTYGIRDMGIFTILTIGDIKNIGFRNLSRNNEDKG